MGDKHHGCAGEKSAAYTSHLCNAVYLKTRWTGSIILQKGEKKGAYNLLFWEKCTNIDSPPFLSGTFIVIDLSTCAESQKREDIVPLLTEMKKLCIIIFLIMSQVLKKKIEVKRFAPVDGSGASLRTVTAIFKTINCYASFFFFYW